MKGKTGAEALNGAFQYGGDAGRYSAQVTNALLGTQQRDLSRLVSSAGRAFGAFASRQRDLQGLIDNFDVFTGALANQSTNLSTTIHLLAPTLQVTHASLVSLNRTLPPLRTYAIELRPAVAELPGLISASKPWLAQVRPLLSGKEAGGVAKLLRESTPGLAGAAQASKQITAAAAQPAQPLHHQGDGPDRQPGDQRPLQHRSARTTASSSTTSSTSPGWRRTSTATARTRAPRSAAARSWSANRTRMANKDTAQRQASTTRTRSKTRSGPSRSSAAKPPLQARRPLLHQPGPGRQRAARPGRRRRLRRSRG